VTKVNSESCASALFRSCAAPVHVVCTPSMPNARTYTLRVVFDKAQLEKLRAVRLPWLIISLSLDTSQAGYRICIAKAVNGKYDVVWSTQK